MPRNYNPTSPVFVNMKIGSTTIKYGFLSRLKSAFQNDLGQVAISTLTNVTGLVFKANYPKPPRASKADNGGTVSSFIDADKIATAKTSGWKIKPSKGRGGIGATTKYVTVNGIKYAWNMPPTPTGIIVPSLATTDVKVAESSDVVVFGASFPKPPRMKIGTQTGEGEDATDTGNYFSTFVDPTKIDALKTAGWATAGKQKTTLSDLQGMIQI